MRFHTKGRAVILLIFCLMLCGCASDGSLKRWGQCALAGAGIGGGLGGIAGSANNSAGAPIGALAGALIGGLICAFTDTEPSPPKEEAIVTKKKEEVIVVVEEPLAPVPMVEKLGSIYFESASTQLSAKSKATLKDLALKAVDDPDLKLTLNGYADNTGQRRNYDNKSLSKNRAKSVRAELQRLGVRNNQVVMGSGGVIEENNKTATGRAENRRVDIIGTI